MKQILKGEKKLLKINEVRFVNCPGFDEIGVTALYDKVVKKPEIKIYMPDLFPKGR